MFNWNKCIELSQGEYLVLLCDDDLLMPNFVSSLLMLVKKYPNCNVFNSSPLYFNSSAECLFVYFASIV